MKNVTLFAQIMQTVDRFSFTKLVNQHDTDKHSKGINSWTHLVTMLFCQFSKLNSLRDVCNGLQSASGNLNHLGVSAPHVNPRCRIKTSIATGTCSETITSR